MIYSYYNAQSGLFQYDNIIPWQRNSYLTRHGQNVPAFRYFILIPVRYRSAVFQPLYGRGWVPGHVTRHGHVVAFVSRQPCWQHVGNGRH